MLPMSNMGEDLGAARLPAELRDLEVRPGTKGAPTWTTWMESPAGTTRGRERAKAEWRGRLMDANPPAAPTARVTARTPA